MLSLSVCEHIVQHVLLAGHEIVTVDLCFFYCIFLCVRGCDFFNCAKFLSFKAQKFKIYTHEGLVVEQIFFLIITKNYFGRCTHIKQLGFGNFEKKKSALLGLENDCSSSCHFFKLLF